MGPSIKAVNDSVNDSVMNPAAQQTRMRDQAMSLKAPSIEDTYFSE